MNTTFGEIIKNAREQKNLKLKDIANDIGIDISTLAKIEKNQRYPSNALIKKISKLLGLDEEKLKLNSISDKVVYQIMDEEKPKDILKLAEEKIDYLRRNNK